MELDSAVAMPTVVPSDSVCWLCVALTMLIFIRLFLALISARGVNKAFCRKRGFGSNKTPIVFPGSILASTIRSVTEGIVM